MQPRDEQSLRDILYSASVLVERCRGRSFDDFVDDLEFQDAVLHRLALIGEAARRLSNPALASIPDVSWPDVVSMRNRVIHQYDDIDLSIVWRTVTVSVPELIARVRAVVGNDPGT
jgi:uncharacterized protein with HEPN domain